MWQAESLEKYETTSLVVDGVLYTIQAPNNTNNTDGNTQIVALDAATGRQFWTFRYNIPQTARNCCGRVNRGLAILGDTLYMGTLNSHLIAINAKNRHADLGYDHDRDAGLPDYASRRWWSRTRSSSEPPVETARYEAFSPPSMRRPERKSGASTPFPVPASPATKPGSVNPGKPEAPGSGPPAPTTPETNLTFWGTGNPNPTGNGPIRLGDNLYSDSVIALDADTGKLKWHYQFTPHDEMDYDSTQVPVLADVEFKGRMRKAMLCANRNGLMYVLDRTTGRVSAGQALREGQLDGRLRCEGPAAAAFPASFPVRAATARPSCRPCSERPTGIRRPTARRPACSMSPPGRTPSPVGEDSRGGTQHHADGRHQLWRQTRRPKRKATASCGPSIRELSTRSGSSR